MNLIRKSANMGLVNFTEMLKFDKIIIPEYMDFGNEDITFDMNKFDVIGVISLVIENQGQQKCTVYDKADLILSLLLACKKSNLNIPVVQYDNFMTNSSFDKLYEIVKDNIIILEPQYIENLQLICIEVNNNNTVKFNK